MLNVSIGGSREGKTGGITGKEQASLFGIPASAYVINACRYPIVIVKDLTHYLIMIGMRFYSCPYN